ncbi:hypothetical protein EK904_013765 [Melospiza melodia maxima]|nr:hypothetical protein EK904_013765 [Melospiza melodia maxima]
MLWNVLFLFLAQLTVVEVKKHERWEACKTNDDILGSLGLQVFLGFVLVSAKVKDLCPAVPKARDHHPVVTKQSEHKEWRGRGCFRRRSIDVCKGCSNEHWWEKRHQKYEAIK